MREYQQPCYGVSRKIYLETIKRIDSDKVYSPCLAGGRFVEIFPDGIVRGCEVEKLWDVSKIGSVNENNLDIVDVVKSNEAKKFQKIRAARILVDQIC